VVGFALTLMGFDPIKALIFAAVVNGLVAVPLVFLIRRIATNRQIMGNFVSGKLSTATLWLTFIIMGICALVMIGASFIQ
jgi:Mn2+/Fe2+ NRAMP family transporter